MDKNKKITKIIITTISLICVLLAVSVISSGLSIMIYRANTPRVIMKQNVTVTEGDTIMLSDVVEKADNIKGYLLGAEWVESTQATGVPDIKGLGPDDLSRHEITVTEGTGKLRIYVTAWGKNHEFTGGETVVEVKAK
ncbi:MAG: hypothetical protein J6X80_08730 [Lachnospiraceae bacterium]|nr:hypothetical protein [Lachnospiraceae bacterium]